MLEGTDLCGRASIDGRREWSLLATLTRSRLLSGLAGHRSASDRHIEVRMPVVNKHTSHQPSSMPTQEAQLSPRDRAMRRVS